MTAPAEPSTAIAVVVAHRDGHGDVWRALDRICGQLTDADIVITASDVALTAPVGQVIVRADALAPELWTEGIAHVRHARVALTSSGVVVAPDWLETVRSCEPGSQGGGGTIGDDLLVRVVDRAVYLTRYARFAPSKDRVRAETADLAADNAWYDVSALEGVAETYRDGFWEPFVHRRLIERGGRLVFDPGLAADMLPGQHLSLVLRQRYAHGRRHGRGWASGRSRFGVAGRLALTPLVPVVMTRRALRARPAYAGQAAHARPASQAAVATVAFALFTAWASGESVGRIESLFGRG